MTFGKFAKTAGKLPGLLFCNVQVLKVLRVLKMLKVLKDPPGPL